MKIHKMARAKGPFRDARSAMARGDYIHILPWDAARMSKSGAALGYDIDRWRDWESAPDESVVARGTVRGIEFKALTSMEREFLFRTSDHDPRNRGERTRRQIIVDRLNNIAWDKLDEQQRNYALSLLWVPEEPRSPLEMLAMQMEED